MHGNERPDSPASLHFVCMISTEPHAERTDSSRATALEGIHAQGRDDAVDAGQAHVVFEAYGHGVFAVVYRPQLSLLVVNSVPRPAVEARKLPPILAPKFACASLPRLYQVVAQFLG